MGKDTRHEAMCRVLGLVLPRRGLMVAALYLLVALASVLILAYAVPPLETPDEVSHLLRTVMISEGHVRPVRIDHDLGGRIDNAVISYWQAYSAHIGKAAPVSPDMAAAGAAVRWANAEVLFPFSNSAQYGPFFYLPQAVALGLGRRIDLSFEESYRVARLASALSSILVAAAAIALTRWGRPLMTVMLLTPMFLFLTVSVSQDGLVIAMAALYGALLTRLWSRAAPTDRDEGWLTANRTFLAALACVLLLSLARMPYVLLSFLLVHPDGPGIGALARRRGFLAGLATPLLAPAVAVVGVVAWALLAHIPGTMVTHDPSINAGAQLAPLLTHPWRIPLVIAASWPGISDTDVQIIGVLGWLSIGLQPWAYMMGWSAVKAAIVATLLQRSGPALASALLAWAVLLAVMCGIVIALYATWTPVGAAAAVGMQGRYFIPLICLGALALPSLRSLVPASLRSQPWWGIGKVDHGLDWVRTALAVVACAYMLQVLAHGLVQVRHAYLGV
ncbi:MAG: DUF2142 domain-containing protein [Azospirillaceae bacterium]|nr:DUF2142 domain-containing protein [Azospirillaceae bacterium]